MKDKNCWFYKTVAYFVTNQQDLGKLIMKIAKK